MTKICIYCATIEATGPCASSADGKHVQVDTPPFIRDAIIAKNTELMLMRRAANAFEESAVHLQKQLDESQKHKERVVRTLEARNGTIYALMAELRKAIQIMPATSVRDDLQTALATAESQFLGPKDG